MMIKSVSDIRCVAVAAIWLWLVALPAATATTPQYQIYDIGVIDTGDDASQGFGVSHGGIAVGRSGFRPPADVRRLPGHCRAASLDCQILPGGR